MYSNRILKVLASMQKVSLQALPEDEPWNVEEFLQHTEDVCRHAAVVSITYIFLYILNEPMWSIYSLRKSYRKLEISICLLNYFIYIYLFILVYLQQN